MQNFLLILPIESGIIKVAQKRCADVAEWQTQATQNRSGNHVGSSPTIGTPSQNSLESKDFRLFFFFLLSFLYFGVFWEDIDDCIRRGHLTGEIQMCINVACCADITVTEPLPNLLQAHAIGIEQTGAGRGSGCAS